MPEEKKESIFKQLSQLDLTEKHKEKNKMTYLPWSDAWASVKRVFPLATYYVVKDENGNMYQTDGKTCRVETSVTIDGLTQNETLAVMDYSNRAIKLEDVTSVNVDKSIKRCLTKNLALFGLDLNLWTGEELSDEAKEIKNEEEKKNEELLKAKINEIVSLGSKLKTQGIEISQVQEVVGEFNNGNKNPKSIKDIKICETILEKLNKLAKTTKKVSAKKENT